MGFFWAKYILFELKQVYYRGVIFHETEKGTKFVAESPCCFKIGIRNFTKFDTSARKSQKNFILMGSFWAKYILFELKKYRGIIFHETEERYKIWRGIDLPFQNWHKEFDKFWPEHSKVSKIFTLMGSFWAKYVLFELKKYSGIIFHETEERYKIWRGIDSSFQNWQKEFDKIWPEHSKI